MIARVAALAAIGASPVSYLLNIEAANVANVAGLTLEDAQGTLIAVAPIVGTARTVSAATAIAEALGLALAIEDASRRGKRHPDLSSLPRCGPPAVLDF